jgi:MurNAc alpha-1-phosphate uridylyltransferase
MLMAAGLGTRLRPFTDRLPKPLLPLMGVPVAQFALDTIAQAGVGHVVANIHHLPEIARAGLLALDRGSMRLEFSDERELLLGSAGGLKKALPRLGGGPFYLVNSDTLCDADLRQLALRHALLRARWGVELTLTVFPAGPAGGKYREILLDEERGLITGFGELVEAKPYFVGVAVLEPEALAGVPDGEPAEFVPHVLERAIRRGKAGAYLARGFWKDIGSSNLWLEAHLDLMQRLEIGRIDPLWRKRIEGRSRRVAQGIWVSSDDLKRKNFMNWVGPCYWSSEERWIPELGETPRHLGPRAVLYGRVPRLDNDRSFENGIGYGGEWISA